MPAQRSFARTAAIVGLIVVGLAFVAALGIGALGLVAASNGAPGEVTFSRGAYQSGGSCRFDAPVTQVTSSDSVHMIASFKDMVHPSDSIQLTITKDGATFAQGSETATATFDCYVEQHPLDPLGPGVYKMKFTRNGTVEAEGTLTVR